VKILQLSPRVPFPLTEGGSIGIFNITRQLSKHGAKIYFVASSTNQATDIPKELANPCEDVLVVRTPKKYGVKSAIGNLFSKAPVNIQKYHSKDILDKITNFVKGKQIDLIHVDHLHMAYYGLVIGKMIRAPVVLREHNLELKIMERFSESSTNPALRAYAKLQTRKFLRYEPDICSRMDKCIMITEQDRVRLLSMRKDIDAVVIPAGVDTDFFKPMDLIGGDDSIAYVGSLDWLPNIDGLKWFVDEVMPIIVKSRPNVKLYVFGKNPSHDVEKLNNGKNVFVKGFIEDVRDVYRQARVMIVPLLAGSGIRIKILEAMAAGKAIVSTSVGCEGIKIAPENNIMVADTSQAFADKVLRLLQDDHLCRLIGKEAASFISEEYSWNKIGGMFWNTYSEMISANRTRAGVN